MIELSRGGPLTLGVGAPSNPVCIVNGIVESPRGNRDVAYLVAANPEVVLALVAVIEKSLKMRKELLSWATEAEEVPAFDAALADLDAALGDKLKAGT